MGKERFDVFKEFDNETAQLLIRRAQALAVQSGHPFDSDLCQEAERAFAAKIKVDPSFLDTLKDMNAREQALLEMVQSIRNTDKSGAQQVAM